jgi:hypothetical protein
MREEYDRIYKDEMKGNSDEQSSKIAHARSGW